MTNIRYERIKEYVKVAREEIMESLGMTETMTDRILKLAIKESKGDFISAEDIDYFMSKTKSLEDYILITMISDEIINFMEGGLLPEEA